MQRHEIASSTLEKSQHSKGRVRPESAYAALFQIVLEELLPRSRREEQVADGRNNVETSHLVAVVIYQPTPLVHCAVEQSRCGRVHLMILPHF